MINKVVWITGASSGIGEALAYACAAKGARLVLSARRKDELIRVAKTSGLAEDQYLILPMDIKETGSFKKLTRQVTERFGSIDFLFNNAGISTRAMALESPLSIDREVMEINYFGSIALTKSVVPEMIRQGSGQVIVTSSVTGKTGTSGRTAYAASKHALHGFYDSLRVELDGTGVGITIVCPGYIRTRISYNALTASGERFNRMNRTQEEGMDPMKLAGRILRGVKKGRQEIYIGGKEILGIYLKRCCPGVLHRILVKQHRDNTYFE